jgi:hypothetical protein
MSGDVDVEDGDAESTGDGWVTARQLCDVCGFQAYHMVVLASGRLFFCGHHFRENEVGLHDVALELVDESELLAPRRRGGDRTTE